MTSPSVSEREIDFLERLGRGETTRDIATAWHMEQTSIWTVAERLRKRLGAKTNEQAVLLACRAGLLDGRPQRHGDHAGYVAHQRRGETPCDACAEGEIDYRAERKARRQQQEAA